MDGTKLEEALLRIREAQELLRFPGVSGHVDKATKLMTYIARTAPSGGIANIAMQVISEAEALHPRSDLPLKPDDGKLNSLLSRLRDSIEEARQDAK
jgi:hypothetical protein